MVGTHPTPVIASVRLGVTGVIEGQAVADQQLQNVDDLVAPVVHPPRPDRIRQRRLVGEAQFCQRITHRPGVLVAQLPLHGAQDVHRHPDVEAHRPRAGVAHLGVEKVRDGGDQLRGGGPS